MRLNMPKTTMNLRVDDKLKKNAENIVSQLGISMAGAITIYLKAIVREKGIPFSITLEGKKSKKYEPGFSKNKEEEDDESGDDLIDQEAIKNAIDKL
jgi:DNA-damage-inducible protein J